MEAEKETWTVAAAHFFFCVSVLVRGSRALLDHSRSTVANIICRHLCLAVSHGCNPGGVSEIWRLLKKAMGAGPDGDDGLEMSEL